MEPEFTRLIVTSESGETTFYLAPGAYLLGRDPACDLVIDSLFIPRWHARLTVAPDHFQVEELHCPPHSGRFVAKHRASFTYPKDLHLGNITLVLQREPQAVPAH